MDDQTMNMSPENFTQSDDAVSTEKLKEILSVVTNVSRGNFETRVSGITLDEGLERDLCNRVNEMIDRADAYVRESTASLHFVAKNQYFRRITTQGMLGTYGDASREINSAADGIANKMGEFSGIVDEITSAADTLNESATGLTDTVGSTTEQTKAVSISAEKAGSNVHTVAAAAEELNASVHEINQQVSKSTEMARDAVQEAERTNEIVTSLSQASKQIEQVVGLINDIARQTNLLALNATIEAARAGEAGRGFSVVASEVKGLAVETAKATQDIQSQVTEIQTVTKTAVASITDIGKTIGTLNEYSSTIAAAVEEQGAATQEIARNVEEVSIDVNEVTSNITEVNANVSQVNTISGGVLSVATGLADQAKRLSHTLNN